MKHSEYELKRIQKILGDIQKLGAALLDGVEQDEDGCDTSISLRVEAEDLLKSLVRYDTYCELEEEQERDKRFMAGRALARGGVR